LGIIEAEDDGIQFIHDDDGDAGVPLDDVGLEINVFIEIVHVLHHAFVRISKILHVDFQDLLQPASKVKGITNSYQNDENTSDNEVDFPSVLPFVNIHRWRFVTILSKRLIP